MDRFTRIFKVDKVTEYDGHIKSISHDYKPGNILVETTAELWNHGINNKKDILCWYPNTLFTFGNTKMTYETMLKIFKKHFDNVIIDDRWQFGKCIVIIEDDFTLPLSFGAKDSLLIISIDKSVFPDDKYAFKANEDFNLQTTIQSIIEEIEEYGVKVDLVL